MVPNGTQGGSQNPQKSVKSGKVLPKVPSGMVLEADPEKTWKIDDFRTPWNPLNEAGTQARAPFSLLAPVPEKVPKRPPKCSLLGTVWAPWAPKCRFWAVLGTA